MTITLDVERRPDADLPARVARTIQDAVASAEGIGAVEVVFGEMGELIWIPQGARALDVEQLVAIERRVSEALRSRAEAARAGAERARADSESARLVAERRADDAALEVRDLCGWVQAAEDARARAEALARSVESAAG